MPLPSVRRFWEPLWSRPPQTGLHCSRFPAFPDTSDMHTVFRHSCMRLLPNHRSCRKIPDRLSPEFCHFPQTLAAWQPQYHETRQQNTDDFFLHSPLPPRTFCVCFAFHGFIITQCTGGGETPDFYKRCTDFYWGEIGCVEDGAPMGKMKKIPCEIAGRIMLM